MGRYIAIALLAAGVGLTASIVWAQFSDTQTSAGTISASSTTADLVICDVTRSQSAPTPTPTDQPGPTPVPGGCETDDSGDDETVFENFENLRPGGVTKWQIRLRNVGTVPFTITAVQLTILELADPGGDCPDGVLHAYPYPGDAGALIVDSVSDGPYVAGAPTFHRQGDPSPNTLTIAPGNGKTVELGLQLAGVGSENCDGNQWSVSWQWTGA